MRRRIAPETCLSRHSENSFFRNALRLCPLLRTHYGGLKPNMPRETISRFLESLGLSFSFSCSSCQRLGEAREDSGSAISAIIHSFPHHPDPNLSDRVSERCDTASSNLPKSPQSQRNHCRQHRDAGEPPMGTWTTTSSIIRRIGHVSVGGL